MCENGANYIICPVYVKHLLKMCASHKLEMRKEAAQEWRVIMRKKLLITAAAIILSADFIAGGTMAIYRAASAWPVITVLQ